MLRTLFFIPHEVGGIPVFGVGWALLLLLIVAGIYLLVVQRSGGSIADELKQSGWFWGMVAVAIVFVLPSIEIRGHSLVAGQPGPPIGIAIRGYGAMMLLGVASAIALAVYRAPRRGLTSEAIFGLAPWVLVLGIAGARLFYVVEYYDQFEAPTWGETFRNLLDFTGGGLVVYGSIMGGFLGAAIYCYRNKIPLLRLGDVVIPCLFLGIFFGRIGCLLNGCCYGGRCPDNGWALRFPAGSPIYSEQLVTAELAGLSFDISQADELTLPAKVSAVLPGSLAAEEGIQVGQTVTRIAPIYPSLEDLDPMQPEEEIAWQGLRVDVDGKTYRWTNDQLPDRALPVVPSQVISSLAALGLCLLLLVLSPWARRYEGSLVVVGFAGYAIIRFGLEMIRSDEPGQFGTSLTISQWVSLATLLAASGLAVYVWKTSRPPAPSTDT
ncbi:Prolipoprotein diacylglyceryl transferase [Roseimaritima multifibrata]|uniref:Phosphatidylglycerol--prolipoprotein diacylglyceryl transferase n=1 Tax=Roseimaritima multifibrata TaxID=1930274 RepID=A0A517M984_9BACT|nr:prolipoprotein diacylglyceryl transferase family protein [Roseimaritima multifibrata]QDS91357.1 Prolipoprotein diacylglyceryl transferase [Roseimaritima multifibrata]